MAPTGAAQTPVAAASPTPLEKADLRILFIGNSLTYFHNQPLEVSALAASAQPPLKIQTQLIKGDGVELSWHVKPSTFQAIRDGHWNYVVLQGFTDPRKAPEKFYDAVRKLDAVIKESGAKTVLHMNMVEYGAPESEVEAQINAYETIAKDTGAIIAPIARGYVAAKAERPTIALQQTDGSKCHPQRPGSYLNICIFFATMTGHSPVGATHVLAGVKPEDAPFLQRVAWETVQKYVHPLPVLPVAQ